MLQSLVIKNFALIDNLQVEFKKGLSIITGETGAGKSILLGGLALVLGKRADLSTLKNKEKKCIVEAEFAIKNYNLKPFFKKNDIDYEEQTIIRREILPSGKSRAFINDTPIVLSILNDLSRNLIDVHSQHQTLQLAEVKYQFELIDALAQNKKYLESYAKGLKIYKKLQKEYVEIKKTQEQARQHYEYNLFLYEELEKANFRQGEQEKLEQKLEQLNNAETIRQSLLEGLTIIHLEQHGVMQGLTNVKNSLSKIRTYANDYETLYERIESIRIELEDIAQTVESESEKIVSNPHEIEKYNARMQLLYDLQKKHTVSTIEALQEVTKEIELKVQKVQGAQEELQAKKQEVSVVEKQLNDLSNTISERRQKAIPKFVIQLEKNLSKLEMPTVKFQLSIKAKNEFLENGKDELAFLISVNKGTDFIPIKKGPSGGEMSRIMLAVKSILSNYIELPTIIFDEIDTGVSGEVSNKIAEVMIEMSKNMQIISITHLPQIAAKGERHYKVYKIEKEKQIITNIKELSEKERINEIAEMLGGKQLTNSALAHAKQLLRLN